MSTLIPSFDFTKRLHDSLGFSLSKLEESYSGYNASNPHRHNYYEVLFFNDSGGFHEIDFTSYKIRLKSIHFISPEQVHLLRRSKHVTGYVLSFTDDFFLGSDAELKFTDQLGYFNNPYNAPLLELGNNANANECTFLIDKIFREYTNDHPAKHEALQSWLKLFLILCKRLYGQNEKKGQLNSVKSEITQKFKKLLEKNFRIKKLVHDYAGLLNITAGHLSDTIQRDTGKTASEYIHDRIILEAKRLLYHSQKSIKEIAADLNYEDPSYFTKFFKSHSGSTPDQFRKTIREKYQ